MPKKKAGNLWLNNFCVSPAWRKKIGNIMTAYRAYTAIANMIHHPRHKVFQAMFVLFLPYLSSWETEQSFFLMPHVWMEQNVHLAGWQSHSHNWPAQSSLQHCVKKLQKWQHYTTEHLNPLGCDSDNEACPDMSPLPVFFCFRLLQSPLFSFFPCLRVFLCVSQTQHSESKT